jgi:lipopolysaccharide transport system permease protein
MSQLAAGHSIVIQPRRSLFGLDLAGVWQYRELVYFLVWREIKVRYKQTVIGGAWALLQPLLTVAIFTMVFRGFARVPSEGLPYPVFALAGLLPWTYFSQAVARSGTSLVGDANLIRKIYFPRLIIPISAALAPLVDCFVALVVLLVFMACYGVTPPVGVVALPLLLLIAVATALSIGLWLSALNVRYRDVGHTIPFILQSWMYASPVAYPVSLVPEQWRLLYSLNPMAGLVEGFRWGLLGTGNLDLTVIAVSAVVVVVLLIGGVLHFNHMERTFADII